MKVKLNSRELATILAALRYWQEAICPTERNGTAPDVKAYELMPDPFEESGEEPLLIFDIEELCDKLANG